jgi:hypothetical protein
LACFRSFNGTSLMFLMSREIRSALAVVLLTNSNYICVWLASLWVKLSLSITNIVAVMLMQMAVLSCIGLGLPGKSKSSIPRI